MNLCQMKVIKFLQNLLICYDHYLLQHIYLSVHLVTMNNEAMKSVLCILASHVLLVPLYVITGQCYQVIQFLIDYLCYSIIYDKQD